MSAAISSIEPMTLDALRRKLAERGSKPLWRSLDELAETPEFMEYLHREFPKAASEWQSGTSRRRFLQLMGASLMLAAAQGCTRQESQAIVPYVEAPRDFKPGQVQHFATATSRGGYGLGLMVESHDGRPTKIDGNPRHPYSHGATDVFAQASILNLYDPDRSQTVLNAGRISTWDQWLTELRPALDRVRAARGRGLSLLTGATSSPTLIAQIKDLLQQFPEAKWHIHEPCDLQQHRYGGQTAGQRPLDKLYDLTKAKRILALDADFLGSGPDSLRLTRQYAQRRRDELSSAQMTRLYSAGPAPNCTTAMADHHRPLPAAKVRNVLFRLNQMLSGAEAKWLPSGLAADEQAWVDTVAADLKQHGAESVVIVGDSQPADVHAFARDANRQLGCVGPQGCVRYVASILAAAADGVRPLAELVDDLNGQRVAVLAMLGGNPVYDAPADLDFAAAMKKSSATSIHLSAYDNETSQHCLWHIPALHELESWSDIRALDGTASIMQPLIEPLYGSATKSAHDLLGVLAGEKAPKSAYERVSAHWTQWLKDRQPIANFDVTWATWLQDGVIADSASEAIGADAALKAEPRDEAAPNQDLEKKSPTAKSLEIVFQPDVAVWDGRYANNGWLQELPRPISKLTWGNVAGVAPQLAERLNLQDGDLVTLTLDGRSVEAPVLRMPGHADNCVSVTLGYGRTRAGHVGNGVGFNAYLLRGRENLNSAQGLEIAKTGRKLDLAMTQHHHSLEGHVEWTDNTRPEPVRSGEIADFEKDPHFLQQEFDRHSPPSLLPNFEYSGYAWGMSIDLNSCVGCNACVVACQAENNIPIVGPEQVRNGREMHWLRIDSYYRGDPTSPETFFQPLACQHCEHAPCELVCPVAATTHSPEGLNEMTYNRCVGTRYCSNNCPYKVRRFNFLEYNDATTPVLKLLRNPEVTVRSRGVMEKCTYCVQRISAARIVAKREDRSIHDGEVVTACQAVCPAQAIVFGDLNDPKSAVNQRKASPLNYQLLGELNTLPRTTYMGRLRNPNPDLVALEADRSQAPNATVHPLDPQQLGAG